MPNLVSLTRLSLQVLGKTQIGVLPISGFSVKKLTTETKIDKRKLRKETRQRIKMDDDIILENYDVIVFLQFIANLQQSGNQILNAQPVKLTFSLIVVTFYLIKMKTQRKNLTALTLLL